MFTATGSRTRQPRRPVASRRRTTPAVLLVSVALIAAGCSDGRRHRAAGQHRHHRAGTASDDHATERPRCPRQLRRRWTRPRWRTRRHRRPPPPRRSERLSVDEDALQATLDQWRTDVGAFGATLSVRVPGHDDIHLASGMDDRDPETPMPTDGTYLAMSITKTVVAAIALQLVDEGRLSLDEPVAAWIPELPNADRITLAMLLGHTSGLGDWDPVDTVLEDLTRSFTPEEVLAEAVAAPPYGQPGEHFAYTNGGYAATGLIIERVLGEPLAAVVDKRVAGPLCLDDTLLGDGSTKPTRHGWFSLPPTTPTRTAPSTPSTSPTRRISPASSGQPP